MTLHFAISFIYKIYFSIPLTEGEGGGVGVPSHPFSIPEIKSEEKEWIIIILS
jgi:hypothetical protein